MLRFKKLRIIHYIYITYNSQIRSVYIKTVAKKYSKS